MPSVVLVPFTARDGENLALYEWRPPQRARVQDAAPPRGVVLMVHGLGEHAGRYAHVAQLLMDWGFVVRAYDQRGHGESGGRRGVLPSESALIDDLAEVLDYTRLHCGPGLHGGKEPLPVILLGHSLGGLVASRFVAQGSRPVQGLVLCSPALDAGFGVFQKLLLAVLPTLAPNWCVNNGLDVRYLSHDERVRKAYEADRQVHRKISARLARFIASAGPAVIAAAGHWTVPTLLLYAGADRLVNPQGSRVFAEASANSLAVKPGTVTAVCFEAMYHELFNELQAAPVFDTLRVWLDARF